MTSNILPSGDFALTLTPDEAANLWALIMVSQACIPLDDEGERLRKKLLRELVVSAARGIVRVDPTKD